MRVLFTLLFISWSLSCQDSLPCENGWRDGAETDVDCGGACATRCAMGMTCSIGRDCDTGVCKSGHCVAATCRDDVKNGAETDVDCGGGCGPCRAGASCDASIDCQSGQCKSGRCAASPVRAISPATGTTAGGISVSLQGMGFQTVQPTAVHFAGVPGSNLTVISDTQAMVDVPAHATVGQVDVDVAFSDGRTVKLPGAFLYHYDKVAFGPELATSLGITLCTRIALADLNQDGKWDLVLGCGPSSCVMTPTKLGVVLGNGDGTFAPPVFYTLPYCAGRVRSADLNGDGLPDVVVSMYSSASIAVLLGMGGGVLGAVKTYPVGSAPFGLLAVDLNGDTFPDLVSANQKSQTLSVLLNQRDGTFASASTLSLSNTPTFELASADFDGNGVPDIASVNLNQAVIPVLLNNANGIFTSIKTVVTGAFPLYMLTTSDWNDDGIPDVVGTNLKNNTEIGLLLSKPDRTYSPLVKFPSYCCSRHFNVVLSDFDRDGYNDAVAIGAHGDTRLSVQMIKAGGMFGSALTLSGGARRCFDVTAADFDGDGRFDLALPCYMGTPSNPRIVVLLNQSL